MKRISVATFTLFICLCSITPVLSFSVNFLNSNYLYDINDVTEGKERFNETYMIEPLTSWLETYFADDWEGQFYGTADWSESDDATINNLYHTDHVYELKIGALAQSGADNNRSSPWASMNVTSVPEPSFLIVLGIYLLLLLTFQRNKVFK